MEFKSGNAACVWALEGERGLLHNKREPLPSQYEPGRDAAPQKEPIWRFYISGLIGRHFLLAPKGNLETTKPEQKQFVLKKAWKFQMPNQDVTRSDRSNSFVYIRKALFLCHHVAAVYYNRREGVKKNWGKNCERTLLWHLFSGGRSDSLSSLEHQQHQCKSKSTCCRYLVCLGFIVFFLCCIRLFWWFILYFV